MTSRQLGQQPASYRHLLADLREVGLPRGRHVLVHCAMSEIGWVVGGPAMLLRAIRDVIGASATVVVPTQTANNSTTSRYYLAATAGMTEQELARYQDDLPGFDPAATPSHNMGLLAEHVRRHPRAVRSLHPQTSFAAVGRAAADLMRVHDRECHLGEESPLAALYRADAMILLVGVGIDRCTALHLAEYRLSPDVPRRTKTYEYVLDWGGHRVWRSFEAPDLDDSDFGALGDELAAQDWCRTGFVGKAHTYLLPLRQAVDFAVAWMGRWRGAATTGSTVPSAH